MYRIYGNALNVLVWLGPESDESNLAMDFLSTLGADDSPGPKFRDLVGLVTEGNLGSRRYIQR